jgi:type IV secretion system protein VirB5
VGTPSLFLPAGDNATGFTGRDSGSLGLALSDSVNGMAQKNARMWQIIALVSLSSFFISLGICAYAVTLPKTVPVIVTINDEGRASYVGRIDSTLYTSGSIPDIAKEYVIRQLITFMYTWVVDQDAQQMFISEAASLVQQGAASQLDLFYRADNPFIHMGERTRSVAIDPPLKQTDKTYIAYFTTTEKNRSGYTSRSARWSILVNLELFQPSKGNPLGLYITNFDIKKLEEK